MSNIGNIYHKFKSYIPKSLKFYIRLYVEKIIDVGKKTHFSQFGEDAVLYSYFQTKAFERKSLAPFEGVDIGKGFYVDVGAFDPKKFSNTYLFYKKGWRGINVDPTPGTKELFDCIRPNDLNIEAAVSNKKSKLTFYSWGEPSVLNTLSKQKAKEWEGKLNESPDIITVDSFTLTNILDNYLPRDTPIDFFTIDAEGHDLEIIQSNDWNKYRPEIVVIEIDTNDIEEVLESSIYKYLKSVSYKIYSWTPPSVFFIDIVDD